MNVSEITAIEIYINNLHEELDSVFGLIKSTWINLSISREEMNRKFSIAISNALINTIKETSDDQT